MKAIIIGAGIGGLTTAIALERQGIHVEIYEKAEQIQAVGAGLTLWTNAISVMRALGMGEALSGLGVHEGMGTIRTAKGQILAATPVNDHGQGISVASIVVHRAELHRLLSNHLKSPIHLGHAFTQVTQTENGVVAQFENGETAQGDVLIAADGIHSPVRRQLYPHSKPIYAGYTAYRAVVEFDHAQMSGMWGESWGRGSRFGLVPLSKNRVYWFATENAPEARRHINAEAQRAYLQVLFKNWHDPITQVIEATPVADILHHDIYDINPLPAWVQDRVVLLGDAAHAMTPNLGQGACQAIEDAYALAHCLSTTADVNTALANYQAIRVPRANSIMQQSRQIGAAGQLENSVLRWMRDQAVQCVPEHVRNQQLSKIVDYDITRALSGQVRLDHSGDSECVLGAVIACE